MLVKGRGLVGVFQGAFGDRDPAGNRANVAQLFAWRSAGLVNPMVTATFPLERGGEAIARMAARGAIGKLVVEVVDPARPGRQAP